MNEYEDFLNSNYQDCENINILRFVGTYVCNEIKKVGQLKKAAGAEPVADIYMSMNPLIAKEKRINRDKEHIGRFKWLYADLDYYNSCYKDYTKTQIAGLLEMDYFGKSIPEPTYVIDSGRGLYLLWRIDEHVNAYSRWEKMQKYLWEQLEEFGADRKVTTDSARVLRQIGSINSKSGTMVHIIKYTNNKYCLTNLLREYVVSSEPSEKMKNYAKSIAAALEIDLPDMNCREAVSKFIKANKEPANLFIRMQRAKDQADRKKKSTRKVTYLHNEYSLLNARLQDLEKLLLCRDYEGGCREHILFLYRYWQLCVSDDKTESLNKVLLLNRRLQHPLDDTEVIKATKSAEKYYDAGKIFRCSNTYVIQALHITPEEMEKLSFFVDAAARKKRKKARNKKAYLVLLKKRGKITKSEHIKQRRKSIDKMLKKGLSCDEICKKLNISRATFYADKHCIECYLAAKEEKKQRRMEKYQEYCQTVQDRCLKFSAFVLNMSFRTSPLSLPFFGRGASYGIFVRSLRAWGRSQLVALYSNSRYMSLSVRRLC